MNDNDVIAKRFAELRTFSDYSTKEMADKLGITESKYLLYESGKREIPINVIYKFADIVDTEPTYITTGILPDRTNVAVVYEGKGTKIERYPGYAFTALAENFKDKEFNPMLVEIAESDRPELVVHKGHEFNFVLEGKLRVRIGEKDYYLREGDSIYFDPSVPHAQMAMGGKAKFLTIISD